MGVGGTILPDLETRGRDLHFGGGVLVSSLIRDQKTCRYDIFEGVPEIPNICLIPYPRYWASP